MENETQKDSTREMTPLGLNSPEEMAKPPAEREVLIGSKIKFSALGLTLALNEFAEEFVEALSNANEFNPVDTMELARDFAVKKIREQWESDWKESHATQPEPAKESAPARNVDRPECRTSEGAASVYRKETETDRRDAECYWPCLFDWLFAPAAEGGAK